jgi:hypothetical protein
MVSIAGIVLAFGMIATSLGGWRREFCGLSKAGAGRAVDADLRDCR